MTRLRIAAPAAALALLGGLALASTAAATPDEPAPAAPAAEHTVLSGSVAGGLQLPTLGLDG